MREIKTSETGFVVVNENDNIEHEYNWREVTEELIATLNKDEVEGYLDKIINPMY